MVKNVFEVRKKCPFCKSKNFQVIFQKNFDSPDIIKFFRSHLNKNFPIKILKNEKYIVLECKRCSGIQSHNLGEPPEESPLIKCQLPYAETSFCLCFFRSMGIIV